MSTLSPSAAAGGASSASSPVSSSRSKKAAGASEKGAARKAGAAGGNRKATAAADPPQPDVPPPGSVAVNWTVEIEADVIPFEMDPQCMESRTAYDNRFNFVFPAPIVTPTEGDEAAIAAATAFIQAQAAAVAAGQPPPPNIITTPPTGLWDSVSPAQPSVRQWRAVYSTHMDRATWLSWERAPFDVHVEERSLSIPPAPRMFDEDGRLMAPADAMAAAEANAAAAEAGSRTAKRKSGSTTTRGKAGVSAEKDAKQKDKVVRRKKGDPKESEQAQEPERTSTAHPSLESQDVPWIDVQSFELALSNLAFDPYSISRTISISSDPSLSPPRGLRRYTIRLYADRDPMDESVRKQLNPLAITIKRVENLTIQSTLKSWKQMNDMYKSPQCKWTFFESGRTEEVNIPDEPNEANPHATVNGGGTHGRESKDATAAATPSPPLMRASPPAAGRTPRMPHAPSLPFNYCRVIYLGLYDRSLLAAQASTMKFRVELHDRDHRLAISEEERAEEIAKKIAEQKRKEEEEVRRAAEEAAASKKRGGGRKRGTASSTGADSGRKTARDRKKGSAIDAATPPDVNEEKESEGKGDRSGAQTPAPSDHLAFETLSAGSMFGESAGSGKDASTSATDSSARYDSASNVYGVAEFGLDDLFRGLCHIDMVAPVRPVYPPNHIQLIPPQRRIDPYQARYGDDMDEDGDTVIHLSLRWAYPLNKHGQGPTGMAHEIQQRYERVMVWFPYNDSILLHRILDCIALCNTRALGLDTRTSPSKRWGGTHDEDGGVDESSKTNDSNTSVAIMSLTSVRLTAEQQSESSDLDVLGSVEIIDDRQRLFLIEGLSAAAGGQAMKRLYRALGRERGNGVDSSRDFFRLLANPHVTFARRLYGSFHVAPKVIRMKSGVTLQSLARSSTFHTLGLTKGPTIDTYTAAHCLFELTRTPSLRVALRANLFPTAVQLLSFDKYYAAFVSDLDLWGPVPGLTTTDRYDPIGKNMIKRLPDPTQGAGMEGFEENGAIRPRSRGQRRLKLANRSIEQDVARIKREKKEAAKKARLDAEEQMRMFDQLKAEVEQQNNLLHKYDTLAATQPLDLAATMIRPVSRDGGLDSRTSTSTLASRLTDAEVAEEIQRGFKRKLVAPTKSATQMSNDAYLAERALAQQRSQSTQFLRNNIKRVSEASKAVAASKSPEDYPRYLSPEDLGVNQFHIYGAQKQNVWDLQKRLMRKQLQEKERAQGVERHYTYNEEYLSASFVKFDIDEEEAKRRQTEKEAWLTSDGFRWPAHKTHAESYHPTKDLHPATIDALHEPPEQSTTNLARLLSGHGEEGSPGVQHPERFKLVHVGSHEFGMPDNEDWGKPIGVVGDAAEEMIRQAKIAEKQRWREKIIVEDPHFRVHRSGTGVTGEAVAAARKGNEGASSEDPSNVDPSLRAPRAAGCGPAPLLPSMRMARTDLVSGMLKDPPRRQGLKFAKTMRDSDGNIIKANPLPLTHSILSMHAAEPFVDQNRTMHMRTLEEKERAELEDTPRNPKPRFRVTAPTPVHHFIHKRKIDPLRPSSGGSALPSLTPVTSSKSS